MESRVEPRRSLRILAKQKLEEEEEQAKLLLQVKDLQPHPPEAASEREENSGGSKTGKGKTEADKSRKSRGDSSSGESIFRKRKGTSSPNVFSPPPKKQARKGKKTGKDLLNTSNPVVQENTSSEGLSGKRQSKRRQSKEVPAEASTSSSRETVIVDATTLRKSRSNKKPVSNTDASTSQPTTSADHGKKGRSKSRSSRSRGKARAGEERVSIPKGKGNWSAANYYSLPSLVDFAKLNMASPE